ncbi:unnamed protein product, partial [Toxocara canis]|uniref:DUF2040 domain-containing protein n=1 Tax=Toxocara canis TaxID=6265 RepID=A0A183VC30_TOXCA
DYDAIYDDLQTKKNEKVAEQKAADRERKSKYAEQIIKAHKRRLLEQQSREERKQLKEREAEGGEFDDKEVFVTGAYRKQMEEMQKFREQEAVENRLDELTAVEKQKGGVGQGGFYRTLLNDLARSGTSATEKDEESIKKESVESEDDEQPSCSTKQHFDKLKLLRRRLNSSDDELIAASSEDQKKMAGESSKYGETKKLQEEPKKKSIYSDESQQDETPTDQPVLKPGLETLSCASFVSVFTRFIIFSRFLVKTYKETDESEQLRSRFTPSPCRSDARSSSSESEHETFKEQDRRRRWERRHEERKRERSIRDSSDKRRKRSASTDRHTRRRHDRKQDEKESRGNERGHHEKELKRAQKEEDKDKKVEADMEKKTKPATEEERTCRLEVIKKLLKQRNTDKDIAEFRRRYLERKESGTVTIPV